MALDDRLLELVRCPETRERLRLASPELLQKLNARIGRGALEDRRGGRLKKRLQAALVREDDKVAYPVVDDIPELLPGGGIPLDQL